jgi:hypothetical protein
MKSGGNGRIVKRGTGYNMRMDEHPFFKHLFGATILSPFTRLGVSLRPRNHFFQSDSLSYLHNLVLLLHGPQGQPKNHHPEMGCSRYGDDSP